METPENPENFIEISVEDLSIYIEKNIWHNVKDDKEITFNVHNYGEFLMFF